MGKIVWNDDVAAPALVVGDQWISYDDVDSIITKTKYAMERGYAGTMVWAVDNDDFQGWCGPKYPLLNAMKDTLEAGISSPTTAQDSSSSLCSEVGIVADPESYDCSCYYYCS